MSSFAARKPLLERLAAMRGSTVISYITGDRRQLETQISPEIVDLFVQHLDHIGPVPKLSLLLTTNGGDTAVAWRLINLLHTFCDELEVIIPSKALSAGTLISLGANRIVMTKQAALGPIDPSVNNPLNPPVPQAPHVRVPVSVEAVRGYLEAAKGFGATEASLTQLLIDLSNKVHPLVLGTVFRSREQIRFLAKKLLVRQVQDQEKSAQIIDFLCAESGSHDYTINRREARELGLQIENPSDELYAVLKQLHASYVEEMKLLEPFDPHSLLGASMAVAYELPRAVIESVGFGSHRYVSEGILAKVNVQQPGAPMQQIPFQQDALHDQRRFEGWRKI
ncbi:SDH family Clp fold serine proteinase [Delftia tsuruhatensis]|uniref:SDH family Clp fold serine proteinase n=1 Tax=Delftia tsuruhatensis TaxID=180282 RepID=UPI0008E08307|nr:hypothetical protein [Delftia tsuruhatensis]SFB51019.1 Serine dehydrogenase proteinase [Delftia tsuruhatensis]